MLSSEWITPASTLESSDQFIIFNTQNGYKKYASLALVSTYLSNQINSQYGIVTEYYNPTTTGFTIVVQAQSGSVWLVVKPSAAFALGTIVLPSLFNLIDKQEISFYSSQAITSLVINGNGATVLGQPSSIAQNGFFTLRFDKINNSWYRVA